MINKDMVNRPPHYNAYSIEVIEVTRHCSFDIGNAIKYMLRHQHKGASQQDLEKALWYIDDHIKAFGRSAELIHKDTVRDKLLKLAREYHASGGDFKVYKALRHLAFDRIVLARRSLAEVIP